MKHFKLILTLFAISLSLSVVAQKRITGLVSDTKGEPLVGATVVETGTSKGTITDIDGKFELSVNGQSITVSYVGYETKSITLVGENSLTITLAEGQTLDDVVVTALGISRAKKSLTYAVDEIKADALTTFKEANVINSLSGRVAGLFISRSGTGIGGSTRLLIRGNKSTTNNDPLYVIDGVPMNNSKGGQQGGIFGGGIDAGDGISNINSEDIVSTTVLKGASAAALYGSQGVNGVILITTRRGQAGKPKVTYNTSFVSERAFNLPELQYTYGQTNPGAEFSWGSKLASAAPDHVNSFYRNGSNFVNSLSVSGGTENMLSYFSYSNTSATGIVPTNDLARHNFNFNQNAKFFDKKLVLDANINFINQKVNNRMAGGLYFNPLTGLYLFPRGLKFSDYADNYEKFDASRNLNAQNWVADRDIQQNPYWILNRNTNQNVRNRVIASASASYVFNDWISLKVRGNIDKSADRFEQKVYATTQATLADPNGRYQLLNSDDQQIYGDAILSFNKNLTSKLNLIVNLGTAHLNKKIYSIGADSKNGDLAFANKFGLQYMKNPISSNNLYEGLGRIKVNSMFGSAQLGYDNFLYFDVTGRNDWSSSLPNSSFFYPSVGASAILSEKVNIPGITFSKVRASYAIVGNSVPNYLANPKEERGSILNGQLNLSTVGTIPGTKLVPEESRSLELGLELKALDNRLGLDFTYYKNNTINQFINISAPVGSGYSRYLVNAGNIQNSGIEAMLSYNAIKRKDFNWDLSVNFTNNKNEVIEVHPEFDDNKDATFFITDESVNSYRMALKKGGSFGDIYGVQFKRDSVSGKIALDKDGKPQKGNFGFIGNPNPKFMLGINNEFTYKGFTLRFLIDGRFGGKVMSMTQALLDEHGVSKATADARDVGTVVVDAIGIDGKPVTGIPAATYYGAVAGRNGITEAYVYDATNIRLRELSLSMNLPKSVVSGNGFIKNVKITVIARNLFFFKNNAPFDPDVTFSTGVGLQGVDVFSLPTTRSFGASLNFNF